jgi:hypothetical protein
MPKQKAIYSDIAGVTMAWMRGQKYASFKYKGKREVTIIRDFLFMGNVVMAYMDRPANLVVMFDHDGYMVKGKDLGIYRDGHCLMNRVDSIYRILLSNKYNISQVNYYGSIAALDVNCYKELLSIKYQASIRDRFNKLFSDDKPTTSYWKHWTYQELETLFKTVSDLNYGLSDEEMYRFEMDKMMNVIGGKDKFEF